MKANGPQRGVNPQIRRKGDGANITRVKGNVGVPIEKSRSEKKLPPQAAKYLSEECLTSLFQRQLQLRPGENPWTVNVVIQISVSVARCHLVRVFLKKELPAQSEAAAAVIGEEARCPDGGRRRHLVALAEGKDIAEDRYYARSKGRTRGRKGRHDKGPS